jgi:hypothetical protein
MTEAKSLRERIAVLREAAEVAEDMGIGMHQSGDTERSNGAYDVFDRLRRMADEAERSLAWNSPCSCGKDGCDD